MEFSRQQLRAIEARGKNLLVSAAAGSGKTTVLVERVLGLLREGVNIDEILIVTFTRAASGDMRQKFYRRLSEEAEKGDRRMYEQLERLELSSISTLHAFCTRVIRQNFELADVDPNFRILTDAENSLLIDQELNQLMEETYAANEAGFARLSFGRSDEALRRMVLILYDFLSARPDPEDWFNQAMAILDAGGQRWQEVISASADSLLEEAVACGEYAISLCKRPGGPMEQLSALEKELDQICAARGMDYGQLSEAVSLFSGGKAGRKSGEGDIDLAQSVSDLRKRMKELFTKKVKELVSLPLETAISDLAQDQCACQALYELATELDKRLWLVKREKCALTFNDLERLTIELTANESVREQLRNQYKYIFLDEYQDTSDIQEAIMAAICRPDNRFMVGDVKQSIYRFRNAVPELFMEKYRQYGDGGENELIVLGENYRSRASVLNFVNLLFGRVMNGGASEIVYDEDARLNPGKKDFEGPDAPVELMIVDKSGNADAQQQEDFPAPEEGEEAESEAGDGDAPSADDLRDAEREAILIGGRIQALKDEDKDLHYRDFCVITRNKKNVSASMAQVLANMGIPAYADESDSAFDALEVSVVINTLKLLLSRKNEVELLSVLRSPMFSLTANELASLRISEPEGDLWPALEKNREAIPGVGRFLQLYARWRLILRSVPLNQLIRRIIDDTGYYTFVGALPGGRHRQANIDMLCELAMNYEQTQGRSLSGFLEHMTRLKHIGDGNGAHELSENDDVVRLMTAHKSKGLEFKVVFAAMLGKELGKKPSEGDLLCDKDLGMGFEHIDEALVSIRPTLATRAIKAYHKRKELAEELRVLYVTLTRAQHRLILTGTVKDFTQSLVQWRLMKEHPGLYKSALDIAVSAVLGCPGCEHLGEKPQAEKPFVRLSLHSAVDILPQADAKAQGAWEQIERLLHSDLWDEDTFAACTWRYPEQNRPYAPLKLAVTGLEKEFTGGSEIARMKTAPQFISGGERNIYTQRGTAVHIALQNLDYAPFRLLSDPTQISMEAARQLNRMADKKLLLEEERVLVKPSVIADFVQSELCQRLLRSPEVKREWSFMLLMPTNRVIPDYPEGESLIVQGTIDLCFMEDGQWVLVDYKTDRSSDDEALLNRYSSQIDVYAEALTRLTGKKVKQALICLVRESRTIEVSPKIWRREK
ncbi:MAG: UvrD-helicase domain-containing protein [Clostridia bacterium]|nr:UvrD-helicase domain-containing protein [Clostridia bacterium]